MQLDIGQASQGVCQRYLDYVTGASWQPSSVRMLLERAETLGLLKSAQ